jgi:cytochrome oxidase Cu insertion factor (SCO1/SenC/PrrC family)
MEGRNKGQKFRKAFREWWLLLTAGGALALVTAVLAATVFVPRVRNQTGPPAPGFTLRDQQGRPTSLAQFRGKVVVLAFIDPECTQICPLTTKAMVEALKTLGPAASSHVQLLGLDVNPMKTKVADVASYTRTHNLQGRWRFLTGSPAQLKSVWKSYHVYVATANGDVEHAAVVYLIDANGRERATFSTPMSYEAVGDQAQSLAQQIAHLLSDYPVPAAPGEASQQAQPYLKPAKSVSLAALGPERQPVVLGGDHPHLVLFFAGWLGQDLILSKRLGVLDGYAALARRQNWPSPVAVDELTTEPSAGAALQELAPLAATLRTPIVQDANGQLADGYRVADLPWFVLSSPSGKILWYHDGWLSAAVLGRDVRTALATR